MRPYSAKLLFQWRPVRNGISRKRRLCEERIVTFSARSGSFALAKAKRIGKKAQYQERHGDVRVFFEFIGILELKDMIWPDEGEVWWELVERVTPSERRRQIIPPEDQLDALRRTGPDRKYHLKAW